jgi:hypothetical protein
MDQTCGAQPQSFGVKIAVKLGVATKIAIVIQAWGAVRHAEAPCFIQCMFKDKLV